MRFKHVQKRVGDCTAKSHHAMVRVTETQFTDDTAVYVTSQAAIHSQPNASSLTQYVNGVCIFGLPDTVCVVLALTILC